MNELTEESNIGKELVLLKQVKKVVEIDCAEALNFLEQVENAEVKDERGMTVLHWATYIHCGNLPENLNDDRRHKLLKYRNRKHQLIEKLVTTDADVNKKNLFGVAPLCFAVKNGCVKAVEILLNHKARVDEKDHYGKTIIDFINANKYREKEESLLEEESKMDEKCSKGEMPSDGTSEDCSTPSGYRKIRNLVLDAKSKLDKECSKDEMPSDGTSLDCNTSSSYGEIRNLESDAKSKLNKKRSKDKMPLCHDVNDDKKIDKILVRQRKGVYRYIIIGLLLVMRVMSFIGIICIMNMKNFMETNSSEIGELNDKQQITKEIELSCEVSSNLSNSYIAKISSNYEIIKVRNFSA